MEKENEYGCGCFGCLTTLIAIILFFATFSLFFGTGEFYNDFIKKVDTAIHCDTVQVK